MPLLPRRIAVPVAVLAAVLTAGLGLLVAGDRAPTGVDRAVLDWVHGHLGYWLLRVCKTPTNPVLLVVLCVLGAALALLRGRRDLAVLVAAGPAVAVLLSSVVLKPVFDRHYYGGYLAYPSGHTTAVASVCAVGVLAVAGTLRRPALTAAATVLAVLVVGLAAVALVGLDYHYATDTLGGIGVAATAVATIAAVLSRPDEPSVQVAGATRTESEV